MNETTTGPGAPQQSPPRPHQDLDRLRRSRSDQYLAGVAGGIGRHFGIDPTVIRVLFVVLTFFGGAGVLVYGVCWLFVPEDGAEHGAIHVGSEPRKLLLLAAVGIGFLLAMGDAFSGFNAGWMIASIAVIVALVLIARDRKGGRAQTDLPPAAPYASPAPPATGAETSYAPPADTTVGFTDPGYAGPWPPVPPAPPAWMPPQPPLVPPHPKRTGIVWFWPTLALIAIGLGILGVVDADHDFSGAAYAALALAITGVMLLIGAFLGRPGGLVLIGLLSSATLAVGTVTGGFNLSGNDIEVTPTSAAAVQDRYDGTNGRIFLDLTQVTDPENLAGREIDLSLNAGEIKVILPPTVNAVVDADFDFAGGIDIPGYTGGGIQDSVERHLIGARAGDSEPLKLDLHATVGHLEVEVEQR